MRMLTVASWRHDPKTGGTYGRRRDAITAREWLVTPELIGTWVASMVMVSSADPPLTADDIAAITADVIAHARREAEAAAAPPPPDNRLTLAAALAGRLLRRHEAWHERGTLMWRRRPGDPVLGGGRDVALPETGGGWAASLGISRRATPGAESVTSETVRDVVQRGNYLQLGEVIIDWAGVVREIENLAARKV